MIRHNVYNYDINSLAYFSLNHRVQRLFKTIRNVAGLSIAYLTLTYVTLQQHMIDHPDYKFQPKKNKKEQPSIKQRSINGMQQGSGAFAPPGGNRGQSSFGGPMLDLLFGDQDLNLDIFGDQDMASANGPVTYGSFGGFVGSSYQQIASHNFIFQG